MVRASQRWRLLDAMTEVVATRGYADASVADAIAIARVSRKTFYECFRDKEDCFLAAFEAVSERLLKVVVDAGAGLPTGPTRRRAQLARFLDSLTSDALGARLFLVDALASVPKALRARKRVDARFVDAFLGDVTDRVLRAAVAGGINTAVVVELRDRDPTRLVSLLDPLSAFVERALAG
jgi:AcrR family transcriptional regulator